MATVTQNGVVNMMSATPNVENLNKKSFSLNDLNVVIVGAGPAGLLLAHKLLKNGAKVTVLERRPDFRTTVKKPSSRAYALGLGIRGRTAIRSVDESLWLAVKARGYESERFRLHVGPFNIKLRDGSNKRKNGDEEQDPSLLLFQNDLCIALLDELERRYPITADDRLKIKFNSQVVKCDLDKQRLDLSQDANMAIPFDLLVGCDGVNSIVREAMKSSFDDFSAERQVLPGEYKTVRLSKPPPKLDPTSVALMIPKKGSATAFMEPTVNGTCCILFAGRSGGEENKNPILCSSFINQKELEEFVLDSFPLLEGVDIQDVASQLISQESSTASTVRCNIYHYGPSVALAGDAAHASGGVSGQGVSSALMDSVVLSDCLDQLFDPSKPQASLNAALLAYSQRQVPEGKALYELSFPPTPTRISTRFGSFFRLVLDFVFQGRFGIGQKPLQTLLTTSLESFSEIRRNRDALYDKPFPDQAFFNQTLAQIGSGASS